MTNRGVNFKVIATITKEQMAALSLDMTIARIIRILIPIRSINILKVQLSAQNGEILKKYYQR